MYEEGTSWNGKSVAHEVTMEDHYGFSWEQSIGVPPNGEASLILPPRTASTGAHPEGPTPYLDTRVTSDL